MTLHLITILAYATYWLYPVDGDFVPCSELSSELPFPCACSLGPVEAALDGNPSISVNCDNVVFPSDVATFTYGAPIVAFSQRWAGYQSLPVQLFSSNNLPLRSIDLSGNSLRKLTEGMLQSVQDTLTELRLGDNLLGDTLNPIFSSTEFRSLKNLQLLDLSENSLKAMEEGILDGCFELRELYLDDNDFNALPNTSLNGPKALKLLSVRGNNIDNIKVGTFGAQPHLETLDLSNNLVSQIESGCFSNLHTLKELRLNHNRLSKFNSDIFQGAETMGELDLSQNFITEFPEVALRRLTSLSRLNLSSNLIQSLDSTHLRYLPRLLELDLSRNNLANIAHETFIGLKQLQTLDLSVNSLRTIEDNAFEGLENLAHLNLKDNNILLLPAAALEKLPRLTSLQLDYNRIAALSGDILRFVADKVKKLVIATNVVRELPPATFQLFKNLRHLDLRRNLLSTLNAESFVGLENTLEELYLSQNRIMIITGATVSLKNLQKLDLSDNHLTDLPNSSLVSVNELKHLNLSRNVHLSKIPVSLLHNVPKLETIDLSYIGLGAIPPELFAKSNSLKSIYLSHNNISEIVEKTFAIMPNLTEIDLSFNGISNIRQSAFIHVMNLRHLNLRGNKLAFFKGEFFNTGTSIEVIDISDNSITYLYPSSFRIHPRIHTILANNNKINFFPPDLIANLQFLKHIDLSFNQLKAVDELGFARLPRLRTLLLTNNSVEEFNEMVFHNSTQLQVLDLSYNKLERLSDRTFEGLIRLERLNLEGNNLADLPDTIFERARLHMLENINLAKNKFEIPPFRALQRQYFFLKSLDLSYNNINVIPAEDDVVVNIKNLDLSYNPLSEKAIENILGEPKTVRSLHLSGTGITKIIHLETPFLKHLNLSHNNISDISSETFKRTTLLEELDISHNNVATLDTSSDAWNIMPNLVLLNVSSNPITSISETDFRGLTKLRHLSLHSLHECSKIEKSAFKNVPHLTTLEIYDFPKLGYLDIHGLLQNMPLLEKVNIETKDASIGKDQLQPILHPRLKELGLSGSRLKTISSGTFSGLKGAELAIRIVNTSLTSLPHALFFPVPRSSKTTLDVTGSQLTTLNAQLLSTLEDRRGDLLLTGLEFNPIICDCHSRALRRWLPSHMTMIRCAGPDYLEGKLLVEIGDDELTCDPKKISTMMTTQSSTSILTRSTKQQQKVTEADIIWSMPTTEKAQIKAKTPVVGQSSMNNDDTLIIGIVGGVVAFIAILVIVICIIRLKMSSNQFRGPMAAGSTIMVPDGMIGSGSSCACSVKGVPPGKQPHVPALYTIPPGYAATLPHKNIHPGIMRSPVAAYSTIGPGQYYAPSNVQQPYFIATYPSEEKIYR
ncbi:protein artichoke isoform X2 [Cylas formicarius]|uniref:protein artichoke isoform X2 n=1 Tax=Cylas formicarius TaxID=197179 RepID=UPI00295852D0|nr:protein artichoke isoform X2 [Cylas formicarius]